MIIELKELKLDRGEKRFLYGLFIMFAVYTIVVGIMLFSILNDSAKLVLIWSYLFIAPTLIYFIWTTGAYWKLKKWSLHDEPIGGIKKQMLFFFFLGICVITWAAFWNSFVDSFWWALAVLYYLLTNDLVGLSYIYGTGSVGVTPALVEEFLKSFPSIIAFFVVLQRNRNDDQKGRGILGNEMVGMCLGLMVGIAFEILELSLYVIIVTRLGGGPIDVFSQVTIRNWAPIHVLGGVMGGYAAGRADRLRFELGEQDLPMKTQTKNFIKRFIPYWLIPVIIHFLWNGSIIWVINADILSKGEYTLFYNILLMTIEICLAVTCFILIIVFMKKATKVALNTHRCEDTGYYVREEGMTCESLIDDPREMPPMEPQPIYQPEYQPEQQFEPFEKLTPEIKVNFCTNCGNKVAERYRFCPICGFDLAYSEEGPISPPPEQFPQMSPASYYRWQHKYYPPFFKWFFISSIILGVLMILISLLFFILTESIFGLAIDLFSSIILVFTSIFLLKQGRIYSGKKNVWNSMFFIFNYIGLMMTLIFFGAALYTEMGVAVALNQTEGLQFAGILATIAIIFGGYMLIMLIIFFKKDGGQYLLHYQKKSSQ